MSAETLITDNLDLWAGATTKKSSSGRGSNGKIELTGVKKLRELILTLAIRGRLIEQSPNDEPAQELLKQCREAKRAAIEQGKLKKARSHAPLSDDDLPFILPRSWSWVRLDDLVRVLNGRAYKKHEMLSAGTPLLRVGNLFTSNDWYYSDLDLEEDKYIDSGDLIYAWSASFGPFIWDGGRAIYHYHIWKLDLFDQTAINKQFLYLYLKAATEEIKSSGSGIAMIHMTKAKMEELLAPIPPLEEQHRIVQKVDELMALCDRLEQQTSDQLEAHETLVDTLLGTLTQSQNATELAENWTRLAAHFDTLFTTEKSIDKLKQTILQLAVMGLLVEQDAGDEPASDLIQRINAERLRLELKEKVRVAKSPSLGLAFGETEVLPDNWATCALGTCVNLVSGQHLKSDEYFKDKKPGSIPYLTGPAEFGEREPKPQRHTFERRAVATTGDILITCKGSGVGKLNTASEDIAISRQLMAVRSILVNTHFLYILLDSLRDAIREKVVGIAIPGISRGDILGVNIQLPPIAEQHRIVKKVDELMALCDQLKERLNQASKTRCQLAESIVENALQ